MLANLAHGFRGVTISKGLRAQIHMYMACIQSIMITITHSDHQQQLRLGFQLKVVAQALIVASIVGKLVKQP